MQPICNMCIGFVGTYTYCPTCTPRVRRNQAIARVTKIVAVLAALVGGAIYLYTRPPVFDYGVHAADVREGKQRVEAERCDRVATEELEDALIEAGDYRGALGDVDAFTKRCGDWYRVHWTAYTAHRRLSDNLSAVADATALITASPTDKDYRWWRGIAYEDMGRLTEAAADYRESMKLRPDIDNIPFNLANVLERLHDVCGARAAIEQYVQYHPDAADDAAVMGQLSRLGNRADCTAPPKK
jgi:tetratricopeptide (TPR) repeat protein